MTTAPVMSITDELLAELEAFTSEHRALNSSNYSHYDVCQVNDWAIGAREVMERAALNIRSLTERLEKAEKDAKRYRWLRRQPNDCSAPRIDICCWQPGGDDSVNDGEGLRLEAADEAIDAAIAQEGADHE